MTQVEDRLPKCRQRWMISPYYYECSLPSGHSFRCVAANGVEMPNFGSYVELQVAGDRLNAAIEALRKARATMACLSNTEQTYSDSECSAAEYVGVMDDGCWHSDGASALLDGFSVDEVTAAEEALE